MSAAMQQATHRLNRPGAGAWHRNFTRHPTEFACALVACLHGFAVGAHLDLLPGRGERSELRTVVHDPANLRELEDCDERVGIALLWVIGELDG